MLSLIKNDNNYSLKLTDLIFTKYWTEITTASHNHMNL